jgi:hypothetical protein
MVIETLTAAAGDVPAYYYRTAAGAQVDLLFKGRGRERYASESASTDERGSPSEPDFRVRLMFARILRRGRPPARLSALAYLH